jgi:hypothetical protein
MHIINTCVGGRQGGILGGAHGTLTILEGCTYSGNMNSNDGGGGGNYGGIVGYCNNSTSVYVDITNCLFDGKLVNTAASPGSCTFGGIVGYANSPFVTIKDCLSIGIVQSARYAQFFGALNGPNSKIYNSYYKGDNINGSGSAQVANPQEASKVADEQLASGEVCYKLNGDQTEINWFQTLGEDAYPVLVDSHLRVWANGDGTYSNAEPGAKGDLNGDGKVDIADAVSILNLMAAGAEDSAADLNGDGKIDIADFVSVLNLMAEQ